VTLVKQSLSVAFVEHFHNDEEAEDYFSHLHGVDSVTHWALADGLRVAREDLAEDDDTRMREKMGGYAVASKKSVATLYRHMRAGDIWNDWSERDLAVPFQLYVTPLSEGVHNEKLWLDRSHIRDRRLDPKWWVKIAVRKGWTTRELQSVIRATMGKKSRGDPYELDMKVWKYSVNSHQELRCVPDPEEAIPFSAQGERYRCQYLPIAPDAESSSR
jgi:hypothetical protein